MALPWREGLSCLPWSVVRRSQRGAVGWYGGVPGQGTPRYHRTSDYRPRSSSTSTRTSDSVLGPRTVMISDLGLRPRSSIINHTSYLEL